MPAPSGAALSTSLAPATRSRSLPFASMIALSPMGQLTNPWTGYGQAKTAQILFSYGLTQRLNHHGLVSFACHPGSNLDTKLGSHLVMEDYGAILPITKRNTGRDFVFTVGDGGME